jgi:hypothetical protein
MDLENDLLNDWRRPVPRGPLRHENAEWAERIKQNVYPNHSDVDFDEYVAWVIAGGGDDTFRLDD